MVVADWVEVSAGALRHLSARWQSRALVTRFTWDARPAHVPYASRTRPVHVPYASRTRPVRVPETLVRMSLRMSRTFRARPIPPFVRMSRHACARPKSVGT